MKKIFYLLLLLVLFPITAFAGEVKITKVEVLNKTDGVEVEESTYDKLVTNLNFTVSEISDSVTYKITVANETGSPFNIDLASNAEDSKYFDYSYTGDTKIEAGKTGTVTVKVDYVKNVEKDDLDDGEYNSNITLEVTSDDASKINSSEKVNPETGLDTKLIIGLSVLAILMGAMLYIQVKTQSKFTALALLPLLLIPAIVKASDPQTLKININSSINVKPFVFRFAPEIYDGISRDVSEPEYRTYEESQIIEYEIPIEYNSLYGENPVTSGFLTDSEIQALLLMDRYEASDTESINAAKAAITDEGEYITYIETSKTITYFEHMYIKDANLDVIMAAIEYDKTTEELAFADQNLIKYEDVVSYIMATNPRYLTCEDTLSDCKDEYNADITNANLETYVNGLDQDFIIKKRNENIYVYSKEGYLKNNKDIIRTILSTKYEDRYISNINIGYKIDTNQYFIGNRVQTTGLFMSDENIIYKSVHFD